MNQTMQSVSEEIKTDVYSSSPKHGKNHTGRWKKIGAAAVGVLVIGAAIFAGVTYFQKQQQEKREAELLQANTYYAGIVVEGIDLGGKTQEEAQKALAAAETKLLPKYDIRLTYEDDDETKDWNITEQDMGFGFNTEQVLKEAYDYARSGSDEERLLLIEKLKTEPKEYKLEMTQDDSILKQKLADIAGTINTAPIDATVASFDASTATFQYKDGKNGIAVDEAALLKQIKSLTEKGGVGAVSIPVKSVPFDVTQAHLKSRMQKLASFTTTSTNSADGNHNMKLSAEAINGSVVQPGAVFSFNQATGDTNLPQNGYRKAVAISGGKKVMEYGGGVCQVSSTLYGAVIRANLEITSRANHMWQSSYVPVGLDATVSYPGLDFKFKNSSDYPIYILAGMYGSKVTVTIYGYQSPDYDKIEITSKQTGTVPQPEDQFVVDTSLKKGEKILDRKGNAGIRASAQRTFYLNGQVVKTEALPNSYYRAIATIYKVGPDTTTSSSPASSKPASSAPSSSKPASSAPASSAPASSLPAESVPSSSKTESQDQTQTP
ncbi:VanW family protein [Clostridium minihomine]|uniref:VanW family protein n=1 Tax=Clostridium minihomine TaxID=2045012 RepID=UPI000C7643D6|nr:VanW family protein [Clostridium minihomine]